MNKLDILQDALKQRDDEVFGYQINIDNYRRAIAKLDNAKYENPQIAAAMVKFKDDLSGLLATEEIEQEKARLIRAVIVEQLEEMKCTS